jgi:hypothetical protein
MNWRFTNFEYSRGPLAEPLQKYARFAIAPATSTAPINTTTDSSILGHQEERSGALSIGRTAGRRKECSVALVMRNPRSGTEAQ